MFPAVSKKHLVTGMSAYTNRPSTANIRSEKDRNADYSTTLFRRLTWEGTVPLEIRVDPKELPANSDRGLECYFIQAPRVSYLPLLVPEIRRFLMDVVFDEVAAKTLKEDDWWFESEEGTLLKWHWPIGLMYDNHTTGCSLRSHTPPSTSMATPMRLMLHLAAPPNDKLFLSSTIDACKQAFMNQLKEADFIRWGNTRRMVGLRKVDQDGLWEGIKERKSIVSSCSGPTLFSKADNFDDFWRVAAKLTPIIGPPSSRPTSPPPTSSSLSRPQSTDPTNQPDRDSAYSMRNVPIRIFLPEGPVLQELAPPLVEDGTPHMLRDFVSKHLPLLFPPRPPTPPPSRINPNPQTPQAPELAFVLVQGVICPPEADLAFLGACLVGADGWLNLCVGVCR